MAIVSPTDPPGLPSIRSLKSHSAPSAAADDGALMGRVAGGDRDAFALVYARHAPPIMSFLVHSLGDRSAAEDLCQETFVRAWRASPRFRLSAPLRPWLFRIARNLSHTEMRRRRLSRSAATTREATSPSEADAGPVADSELAVALYAAVGALSERLRSAFVLLRMEGLSYEDAAQLLNVPIGTVKSRASAAEVELRRRLSSYWTGRSLRPGGDE